MKILAVLVSLTVSLAQDQSARSPMDCRDWRECRDSALAAAEREDYESFHDLAWRAVQQGPANHPELLTLLARAQSRSGRPHDALVMLQRLAAMGVVTDAATSDDFRRVRALSGWSELEARLAGLPEPEATAPGATATPVGEPRPPTEPGSAAAMKTGRTPEPRAGSAAELLRFSIPSFTPGGLAYDGVSGRFIVGHRHERKLSVIGERSHNVSNLTGAGFGEIAALEIDAREGDLWVVSTAETDGVAASTLHKLQLISGRVLHTMALAPDEGPARFVDVAVTPQGSVLVLDRAGRRLLRVRPRSREMTVAVRVDTASVSSVAPVSETIAYVAHETGLLRIDEVAGTVNGVTPGSGVDLSGVAWIRWNRGSLIGIQRAGAGFRVIRIALDRAGRTARSLTVLDRDLALEHPTAATIRGDALYYLSDAPGTPGDGSVEIVVRRVELR